MWRRDVGVVAVLSVLVLGGGTAWGVQVHPREMPRAEAPAATGAEPDGAPRASITTTYRDSDSPPGAPNRVAHGEGEILEDLRVVGAATDGTYTGNVGTGREFSLTVTGNKIKSWTAKNFSCPGFTVTETGVSTTCNIAGNNTFTCGSLGCATFNFNTRIAGTFSGNTVTGTLDADFQTTGSCCQFRNLAFTASRASVPNAPSNLTATAISDDRIDLDWNDNSSDENEFRVESKVGGGSFVDIGSTPANVSAAGVTGLDPATTYTFRVRARNATGNSGYSNEASATTFSGPSVCNENATTLCLNNNRFRVQATFETAQPQSGQAQVVELTDETGYLWFFSAVNVEAVIKVINACSFSNHYWVFAGGLTDVRVVITVTDTQTGAVKQYTNPLGTKFAPIQDTSAFATCP